MDTDMESDTEPPQPTSDHVVLQSTRDTGPFEKELGELGVWSVSSAKSGAGISHLRDGNLDTFWQSDGAQPIRPTGCLPTYSIHSFIPLRLSFSRIQFQDVTKVSEVSLYLSESLDESYTPCKVAISIGTSFQELDQLDVIEVSKPEGWVCIRLEDEQSGQGFVLTEVVQIAIVESHLSGKDTHVRQVKIFGPIT